MVNATACRGGHYVLAAVDGEPRRRFVPFDHNGCRECVEAAAVLSAVSRGTELRSLGPESTFNGLWFSPREARFVARGDDRQEMLGQQWVGMVTSSWRQGLEIGRLINVFGPHGDCHHIRSMTTFSLVPEGIPAMKACHLHTVEVALQAVHDANVHLGEGVVIIGCGLIGLIIARILRRQSIDVTVVGRHLRNRELAREVGCSALIAPTAAVVPDDEGVVELVGAASCDVLIEASGDRSALRQWMRVLRRHGRVVVVSYYGSADVTVPLGREFHHNALELRASMFGWGCGPSLRRWDRERLVEVSYRLISEGIVDGLTSELVSFWDDPELNYRTIRSTAASTSLFSYGAAPAASN